MRDPFDTARIEAFSDGVFAIAITLLVLEISVPEDAFDDLWRGIADQWPSYLAYVTSFSTSADCGWSTTPSSAGCVTRTPRCCD